MGLLGGLLESGCFLIGRLAVRAVLLRGHPGIKHNGRSQGDVR